MIPTANAPFVDGGRESSSNYAQEVGPWSREANLSAVSASAHILNIDPAEREVRMAARSDQIMGPGGATGIARLLHGYFAPDAADSVCEEVALSSPSKRATQTTDGYFARFDPLPRKAESKMKM